MDSVLGLVAVLATGQVTPPVEVGAVRIQWDAPSPCPGASRMERELRVLLPAEASPGPPRVDATARVRRTAENGFELTLELRSASGTTAQRLEATECSTLVEAGALIVALAVDPMAAVREVESDPPGLVPPPVAPVAQAPIPATAPPETTDPIPQPVPPAPANPIAGPSVVARAPAPSEPGRKIPVRLGLRLTGGANIGVLPTTSGGVGGVLAVFDRRWRAETMWMFDFPAEARSDAGVTADVGLWWGSLRGCGVPGVRDWSFPLCGGIEAGALRGQGTGTTVDARADREPWLAVHAGPGVAWSPTPPIALVLQPDLVVPLLRGGFRVGDTPVYEVGAIAGRFLFGLEFRTP